MARINKKRPGKEAVAIVVDGKNEKWYVEKVKIHYPCSAIQSIKVKPELPDKRKNVQDLFDLAKNKLNEEYTYVVLILDLDVPLSNKAEFNKLKVLYNKYLLARNNKLTGRQKASYGWMSKLLVVVNNPCLEYWYLLHYSKTTKFFANYQSLLLELKKISNLSTYDKCESYYNGHPDIYQRLETVLKNARSNAIPFNINSCNNEGGSEMNLLFDYFDSL